ncbi:Heterokaryon incompatibility protein (HET) domain containing protein [Rhypophila decipiens]
MFTYKPLAPDGAEIRLVEIKPSAEFNDPLECSVLHMPFQDDMMVLPAEAISYTWGHPNETKTISLDGYSFPVTTNLESALRHLRHDQSPRRLWIDAICINQTDNSEKATQIPIMHLIYYRASRVVVWLGDGSSSPDSQEDSRLAVEHIRGIHSLVVPGREEEVNETRNYREWPMPLFPRPPFSKDELRKALAFYRLLAQPWWQRAWITQEVTFGRNIIVNWGRHSVTWVQMKVTLQVARVNHVPITLLTDLSSHGSLMEEDENRPSWPAQRLNNALRLLYDRSRALKRINGVSTQPSSSAAGDDNRARRGESDLAELSWSLGINRARACQLPHDRIYSVLGITGEAFRDKIHPSYTQPVQQLYCSLVKSFYDATGGCLDIILQSQHGIWHDPSSLHPSWAPDWSQAERIAVFHLDGHTQIPLNFWGGKQSFGCSISSSDTMPELSVRGWRLGGLHKVGLEFDHLLNPEQPFFDNRSKKLFSPGPGIPPPLRGRTWWEFRSGLSLIILLDPLIKLLPGDDPIWGRPIEAFLCAVALFAVPSARGQFLPRSLRQALATGGNDTCNTESGLALASVAVIPEEKRFSQMDSLTDELVYLVATRTIGQLEDGRLLLAPDSAEEGDGVCILAGCSNAVVLRSRTSGGMEGEDPFTLLGDCYVMGLHESINNTSKEPGESGGRGLMELVLV